jgi:hypothetical protein
MSQDEKARFVQIPDDLVAKCEGWAAKMVEHYRGGDELEAMPWTRDLMPRKALEAWLANRKEAGRAFDIETCELGRWYAYDLDPYGVSQLSPEEQQIGKNRFVRSSESRGWVHESDLPSDKFNEMYDRIEREADTYENYLKRPKDSPELWRAKHNLWTLITNYACFIRWKDEDRAAAIRELTGLAEKLKKEQELFPDLFDPCRGDGAVWSISELVGSIMDTIIQPAANGFDEK